MIMRAVFVASAIGAIALGSAATASAAPFRNCTEARSAGYSNIPSDSPYYGYHLDRDQDGIGCESR